MIKEKEEEIQGVISPILDSMGLELVDLDLQAQGRRSLLRIYIDKAGGVTITDCEQANRFIGHALDVSDPFPGPYTLEVSSPGLDRPLKKLEDYKRYQGKLAKIKLTEAIDGNWTIIGRLMGVQAGSISIKPEDGEAVSIPLSAVAKARLEVEW
ncbi:MAG TPA: ribosome maturation factor RimP [Nitrospiria bacterium]